MKPPSPLGSPSLMHWRYQCHTKPLKGSPVTVNILLTYTMEHEGCGHLVDKTSAYLKKGRCVHRICPWKTGSENSNKANLRDLIAATGLVILLKFDPIHRFFSLCDLEIWCMTLKNNAAPLLYYIKLCVSFQIHRWIQTKVTVRKRSIRVKIGNFFVLCDLEIWWMTLENNRAPLLYYIKLCASFHTHWWFQISVSLETLNSGQNWQFFEPCDLEILRMTLQNNRAPLLCYFKLCAAFRTHWWIHIGVTLRKRPIWVKFDDF